MSPAGDVDCGVTLYFASQFAIACILSGDGATKALTLEIGFALSSYLGMSINGRTSDLDRCCP